jgi:hypothetical protein
MITGRRRNKHGLSKLLTGNELTNRLIKCPLTGRERR